MTHPEALRLADRLDCGEISYSGMCKAAAELRRLHESNQELIAALKEMLDGENKSFRELCEQALAAINKAEGETK